MPERVSYSRNYPVSGPNAKDYTEETWCAEVRKIAEAKGATVDDRTAKALYRGVLREAKKIGEEAQPLLRQSLGFMESQSAGFFPNHSPIWTPRSGRR